MPLVTNTNKWAYLVSMDGLDVIRFDVITQETHTLKNAITENPVESGGNVTDHVRAELDTITLEVFVSNQPIDPQDRFSVDGVSGSVSPVFVGVDKTVNVLVFDQMIDNVSETFSRLRRLRDNATLMHVVTKVWDYTDMVIQEVGVPRTASEGDGAKMTISFKQLRLVSSKLVPAPIVTEPRAKKAVDKGAKNPAEVPDTKKQSVASKLLGGLKDLFK
jgi:hypothetical protein